MSCDVGLSCVVSSAANYCVLRNICIAECCTSSQICPRRDALTAFNAPAPQGSQGRGCPGRPKFTPNTLGRAASRRQRCSASVQRFRTTVPQSLPVGFLIRPAPPPKRLVRQVNGGIDPPAPSA